jgi:hypothetical protein
MNYFLKQGYYPDMLSTKEKRKLRSAVAKKCGVSFA